MHKLVICESFAQMANINWKLTGREKFVAAEHARKVGILVFDIIFSPTTEADTDIAREMLLKFPYHGNYVDLVRMEMNAIASVRPDFVTGNFAFIGSGPLPLTSLCISHHLKSECVTCHNFDHDASAIATAVTLCKALGRSPETMCFQCASAGSPDVDLRGFDIVYLAALVGACSRHKHEIIADVVKRMKPGALVVMRSAHSLRRLLYPVRTLRLHLAGNIYSHCSQVVDITEDMASIGLRPLLVVHPFNHIINSAVIAVVEPPCGCGL